MGQILQKSLILILEAGLIFKCYLETGECLLETLDTKSESKIRKITNKRYYFWL